MPEHANATLGYAKLIGAKMDETQRIRVIGVDKLAVDVVQ
jgi:hypothetical protein